MLFLKVLFKSTFGSVQFNRLVMSDSLRPHELQHARRPWPSPTSWVYPSSCPWSWWCHSAISFSIILFSSCPQSLPALGSFPMSQLFASGSQSIGVSASTSVLLMMAMWKVDVYFKGISDCLAFLGFLGSPHNRGLTPQGPIAATASRCPLGGPRSL